MGNHTVVAVAQCSVRVTVHSMTRAAGRAASVFSISLADLRYTVAFA